MTWEIIEPYTRQGWQMGTVIVRSVKTSVTVPKPLVGKTFNWQYDAKENIAKIQVEEKSLHRLRKSVSFPKKLRELFKDDQAVCFYDEDAIYFATYKAGQKKLIAFLKSQRVM